MCVLFCIAMFLRDEASNKLYYYCRGQGYFPDYIMLRFIYNCYCPGPLRIVLCGPNGLINHLNSPKEIVPSLLS